MLHKDLFTFSGLQTKDGTIKTDILLNESHPIFKGHFPGQPILPGVCMLQIIKEIAESATRKKIQLVKAGNLKFLSFIDPYQNKHIQLEMKIIDDLERIKVDAQLFDKGTVVFKFNGVFAVK